MSDRVDNLADKAVVVPARPLADLLELVSRAADRLDPNDPLTMALRGTVGEVSTSLILEP